MHNIYQGINVDKLIGLTEQAYKYIYTNFHADMALTINYSTYKDCYGNDAKPTEDITEDMLNRALSILSLTNDLKLALKSLIKE